MEYVACSSYPMETERTAMALTLHRAAAGGLVIIPLQYWRSHEQSNNR